MAASLIVMDWDDGSLAQEGGGSLRVLAGR
jgi:hypothetical protein